MQDADVELGRSAEKQTLQVARRRDVIRSLGQWGRRKRQSVENWETIRAGPDGFGFAGSMEHERRWGGGVKARASKGVFHSFVRRPVS